MNIELREYVTTVGVPLDMEERDLLSRLVRSLLITPTAGTEGLYDLRPGSQVGSVRIGEGRIIIRPKVEMDRVLFLVSYAMGLTRWDMCGFDYAEDDSLLEAIVPGFVAQVARALRRGVLQGYRTQEETLLTVRGRIRFEEQFRRRYGRPVPIEVTYDDYTDDIEVNRILKAAIARLEQIGLRSVSSRRALRSFDGALANVSLVEYAPHDVPEVGFNRLNEHYRPAVELARLILANSSFDLLHGRIAASAFLVDMNKVFEDFVVVALRDALGLSSSSLIQGSSGRDLFLDSERSIRLLPDFSWWEGDRCLFVGDAKYKKLELAEAPNADLYQILAYAIATGLPCGTLVYAAGEAEPGVRRIDRAGKEITVFALDLTGPPEHILAEIEKLADHIRRSRTKAA